MEQSNDGGFLMTGITYEMFEQAIHSCPECGCCCGTHWPKCSLETREPIIIDIRPRSIEDVCRIRGIDEESIKLGRGDKYLGPERSLSMRKTILEFGTMNDWREYCGLSPLSEGDVPFPKAWEDLCE